MLPISTRSSIVSRWAGNLRIVSVGPLTASGGMIALTREPSGSRASTSGWLLSIRRPTWATIRSMIDSVTLSEMNRRPDFSITPVPLDVDLVAADDHDFGDRRRPQQVLQRPEAEDRVLEVLLQRAEDEVLAQLVVQVRADQVEDVVEAASRPAATCSAHVAALVQAQPLAHELQQAVQFRLALGHERGRHVELVARSARPGRSTPRVPVSMISWLTR